MPILQVRSEIKCKLHQNAICVFLMCKIEQVLMNIDWKINRRVCGKRHLDIMIKSDLRKRHWEIRTGPSGIGIGIHKEVTMAS